ncbi:unnamed protein product [Penicillium manginii]
MTTSYIDNETPRECSSDKCSSSGIPTPQLSPQLRPNSQSDSGNEPLPAQSSGAPDSNVNTVGYEGFQFFKADPLPGQKATWSRVERTHMHLSQSEFYKMVHKRANKVSAAQQYQNLSDTRRAHVNQLIHEQRRNDPSNEWSCVYAKECDRASKPRNAHRDDYETVSMDVILMRRPMKTKLYPRTAMGDLVDLGMTFTRQDSNRPSAIMMPSGYQAVPPFLPGQKVGPGYVVQGPLQRPVENRIIDNQSIWSSEEATSDDDDESMIFDESQSDVSSETEHPDGINCECQEPSSHQDLATPRQRSCSPGHREAPVASHGPQHRRRSVSRNMDRKLDRYHPLRYYNLDMMAAKNSLPVKRARGSSGMGTDANKTWEKKYRIQRIDDEELRSRLLDCEARIEQWERAFENQTRVLQKTMKDSRQLQRRRSFWDFSSMRHCGCDCTKTGVMGNNK